MSEQDDEQWITERLDGVGSCADDMRAAIARGYERGKAEGAAERDRLTSQLANERTKSHDLTTQVTMLRERLAATQVDAPDRLAALEQRVGALIDMEAGVTSGAIGWTEYRTRLAALRAPGMATSPMDAEVLYQKVWDALKDVPTGGKFHAYEVVADVVAALATARREREEALGVVRAMIQWQADMEREEEPVLFDSIIARARALVGGEAGPSKLDAIMTEREAEIIGESFAAERELRAEIATLRASLAEAQGEVERLKRSAESWEADALREAQNAQYHREKRAEAESDRDALRAQARRAV